MTLVHRRNIRASVKNRLNFPVVHHYEHDLIDKLVQIYKDLFKEDRLVWWSMVETAPVFDEPFGMVPVLPQPHQDIVTDKDVIGYPETMKYMAKALKEKVPCVGVCSKEEKSLYIKSVANYVTETGIDGDSFSNDWNNGSLKQEFGSLRRSPIPSGNNKIWRKRPFHLETYYTVYCRARERKSMIKDIAGQYEEDDVMELEFLEVAEQEVVPMPIVDHGLNMVHSVVLAQDAAVQSDGDQQEGVSIQNVALNNNHLSSLNASVSTASCSNAHPINLLDTSANIGAIDKKPRQYKTCMNCMTNLLQKGMSENQGTKLFLCSQRII